MRKLGISIYPEKTDEKTLKQYIDKAGKAGFSRIFSCLLSVNEEKEKIKEEFKKINLYAKKFGINSQMLHSYRLTFPIIKELPKLSEKVFEVDVPKNWRKIYGNMEIKGA